MHSSSRNGAHVIWVAVHTAEGADTVQELRNFFQDTSDPDRGSSHAAVDADELAQGGVWVPYDRAAWTLRNGNSRSDNLEICGWAAWSRATWLAHDRMLTLVAQWIAARCKARGIPIRKLTPAQVGDGVSGVIGHRDYTLGTGDGTHTDPGPNFPWDVVISRAQSIASGGTSFMAGLTAAEQEDLYARIKSIQTTVNNVEAFVEPPDDWTVRVHWLATALSAVRNNDIGQGGDTVRVRLTEIAEAIDGLKTYVEGLQ